MQLRHLQYFSTLARVRHFAKAATECGVTQPTLSAGLVSLEHEFGHRLVERDKRFIGLTAHGEAMLPWVHQILGAVGEMAHAVSATAAPVSGTFNLAAIPASLPFVGVFGKALLTQYPHLSLSVTSATSREIERGLNAFEYDAGITYIDHEPLSNVISVPLYEEKYLFITQSGDRFDAYSEISWDEVVAQPLCLLHQGMQHRRILDQRLGDRLLSATPQVVADSHISLLSMVRDGGFAAVIPDSYTKLFAGLEWARLLPIQEGDLKQRIGLVAVNRDPMSALARVGISVAAQMKAMERQLLI